MRQDPASRRDGLFASQNHLKFPEKNISVTFFQMISIFDVGSFRFRDFYAVKPSRLLKIKAFSKLGSCALAVVRTAAIALIFSACDIFLPTRL